MGNEVSSADSGQSANPQNGENQKACSATCGVNQAYVGKGEATGPGSTQVNANHIIQYPRQPKMDDGKWIAVASLIGSILGKFADNGTVNKAKNAERDWEKLNKQLHNKGLEIWDRMPKELKEADDADADLKAHHEWNTKQRDAELERALSLDNCNDELHRKVCEFATCGYKPDYDGIKSRIMADVSSQTKKSRLELAKNLNRYSAGQCCGIETSLATASIATAVGALYKAREDERARAWQINEGLIFKATELMERNRTSRAQRASELDKVGVGIQRDRYTAHNANWLDFSKVGADFLSSAGKNYAWLAESYRKTADKMSGDLANLGALIAVVAGAFLNLNANENNCGGGK